MSTIVNYGDGRILFLDLSSSCTGWCVASQDVGKKEATIHKAGVIWFNPKWENGEKYNYLAKFIANVAFVQYQIDSIVVEGYMVNKKRICGVLVIPEMTGVIRSTCYEVDPPLSFDTLLPQVWRSILGIKKNTKYAGVKMWKLPTKQKVDSMFPGRIPQKMVSNITKKERNVPTDLYDSLSLALAWFKAPPNNCMKFVMDKDIFV